MKKVVYILILFSFFTCNQQDKAADKNRLFELFQDPPAKAKPFVRWWWNGNCIEVQELVRELDIMKNAGIGGIEINPIGMPSHDKLIDCQCYEWLSPEWNRLLKLTIEEARKRDMISDLIAGSGWPYGGMFLQKDERIKGVGINKIKLKGPKVYKIHVEDIMQAPGNINLNDTFEEADPKKLFFLRMVPVKAKGITDVIDIMNLVDEKGRLSIEVPEGEYELYVGTFQNGFRKISHGAPGSDGPVLDHFKKEAVLAYLNRLSNTLESVLGGKLGDHIRAIFCDSIELSGANWTDDFKEEFIKKNGYIPDPWYPFIFYYAYSGYTDTLSYSEAFNDSIRRARYDFNKTIIDVFLERFTQTLHSWAHEHNMLSRYQAYGSPWLVGISEGYMIPDIPESNNWIAYSNPKGHGFWIWNKYAASSAHFTGKPIVSSESMTNTRSVFQTNMEKIKQDDDFNFITGINHSVLHGFNYSPPEAGFPGWIRFGTYFSENNTWWPYFHLWCEYNARLSAVFQEAKPVAEVAILVPFADHYSNTGLFRLPIHLYPWYAHDVWESCSQLGFNADYLNEAVIKKAEFRNGKMIIDSMSYQIIFVAGANTLEPETALALEKYAKNGGHIVFIENLPHRSPSLKDFAENDKIVKKAINEALKSNRVQYVQPPEENKQALLDWTKELLEKFEIKSPVSVKQPSLDIYQNHFRYKNQSLYFFSNQNKNKTTTIKAEIDAGSELVPWIWLPETGQRLIYPFDEQAGNLSITLQPLESMLIVYDKKEKAETYASATISHPGQTVDGKWRLTFKHINNDTFSIESPTLIDFSESPDERLPAFAGSVDYQATIELKKEGARLLDLGDVSGGITELIVNGENLGTKWYGRHLYDLGDSAKKGINQVKIIYTTILANYTHSMKESGVAQDWTKIDKPIQQGVIGPIVIY